MRVTKYIHLFRKVKHTGDRRHSMEPIPLPYWIYLTITRDNDIKYLTVHSLVHTIGEVRLKPNYTAKSSNKAIIADLSDQITDMFLSNTNCKTRYRTANKRK